MVLRPSPSPNKPNCVYGNSEKHEIVYRWQTLENQFGFQMHSLLFFVSFDVVLSTWYIETHAWMNDDDVSGIKWWELFGFKLSIKYCDEICGSWKCVNVWLMKGFIKYACENENGYSDNDVAKCLNTSTKYTNWIDISDALRFGKQCSWSVYSSYYFRAI